ncbi:MAG: hypothetical protein GX590_07365, partial [Lentisphaerae bacterium]|nr:hypothetical protein [Lentisphaerota bacterium]
RIGQQALRPSPPPSLSVRARRDAEGVWELLRGELTASFARLSSSGTATAGAVQGSLDLTRLAGDLKPIVPALPRMVGQISVAASTRLPHDAPRGAVAAELVFREVAVEGGGDRPWVLEAGRLTADAELLRPASGRWPRAFERVNLGFAGSPGTLTGRCDRCQIPAGTNRLDWLIEGGQMQARFDLNRLATFLRPLATLPPRAAVAGQAVAGLTFEVAGGVARAAGSGAVQGFALTSAGWDIREPDARFDGRAEWEPATRGLHLSNLTARASFGSLSLPQASFGPGGLRGALRASLDLGVLSGWRKGAPRQQATGTLAFRAQADSGPRGEAITLEAQGTGVAFMPADGEPWEEPTPTLALALHRPTGGGTIAVQRLDLALSLGQLQGTGTLRPGESLALAGTLALDFDALTRWLHSRGLQRATFEGREPRPFVFHAPLGAGAAGLLAYGHGSLALHLARFSGFGLEARPADVQLTLTNGLLGAAYAPPLASGTLRARGDIALTTTPRVLHLDREAVQLKDIPLTDALLDGLHYVNPLLASATVIEGRASLTLGDGHLPLDGSYVHDTAFDLGLEIDDAVLMPSGVLAQILAHTGAANHSLTLGHETLHAVCRDGRIEIAPHQAMLRDHAVTFSGQIGLDQSLQFLVDVPLTRDLVGEKAAAWIAGQTLRVPAGGTVRKPRIDTDALIRQVRGIVAETARRAGMEQAGQAAELIEKLRKKLK